MRNQMLMIIIYAENEEIIDVFICFYVNVSCLFGLFGLGSFDELHSKTAKCFPFYCFEQRKNKTIQDKNYFPSARWT